MIIGARTMIVLVPSTYEYMEGVLTALMDSVRDALELEKKQISSQTLDTFVCITVCVC